MIYVFDSGAFIDLFRYYYPDRFPSLWGCFDALISESRIISVREASRELDGYGDRLSDWVRGHRDVFPQSDPEELAFVAQIFSIPHFQMLVRNQERYVGNPVADPFLIAKAKVQEHGCVVTQEILKPNAAKIPNVCEHFGVQCLNLEAFMERENWRF